MDIGCLLTPGRRPLAGSRGPLFGTDNLVGQPICQGPGGVEMEPGAQVGLHVLERPSGGHGYPPGEALDPFLHVGGLAAQLAGYPDELGPRLAEVDVAEDADAPAPTHG